MRGGDDYGPFGRRFPQRSSDDAVICVDHARFTSEAADRISDLLGVLLQAAGIAAEGGAVDDRDALLNLLSGQGK
ncbi:MULTISPECIES: hypothetical protein [unclassified Streptomyces]|uniref:Uncharacterized protein n=1 Tax=Streptomyces sp. NBC_00060 TaxID=2975636 RepID=A0AAU2HE41_9ACTN